MVLRRRQPGTAGFLQQSESSLPKFPVNVSKDLTSDKRKVPVTLSSLQKTANLQKVLQSINFPISSKIKSPELSMIDGLMIKGNKLEPKETSFIESFHEVEGLLASLNDLSPSTEADLADEFNEDSDRAPRKQILNAAKLDGHAIKPYRIKPIKVQSHHQYFKSQIPPGTPKDGLAMNRLRVIPKGLNIESSLRQSADFKCGIQFSKPLETPQYNLSKEKMIKTPTTSSYKQLRFQQIVKANTRNDSKGTLPAAEPYGYPVMCNDNMIFFCDTKMNIVKVQGNPLKEPFEQPKRTRRTLTKG